VAGPHNLEVGLLRTFVAVAESGRITKAARTVNVSQSAASQQIGRLESFLGIRLLERTPNAVRLTAAGKAFYDSALRLIALNDQILGEMRSSEAPVEIRLGVPHDLVGTFMPTILARFRRDWPGVVVRIASLPTSELSRLLDDGQIDLTLTTEPRGLGVGERLLTAGLVWVGARDGAASRARPLTVALGEAGDGFRRPTIDALNRAAIPWRSISQVGGLDAVFAALEADMAIAPLMSCAVPERLSVIGESDLPDLPVFDINLRVPERSADGEAGALADVIRHVIGRWSPAAPERPG